MRPTKIHLASRISIPGLTACSLRTRFTSIKVVKDIDEVTCLNCQKSAKQRDLHDRLTVYAQRSATGLARSRAMARLRDNHREEYEVLRDEEFEKAYVECLKKEHRNWAMNQSGWCDECGSIA